MYSSDGETGEGASRGPVTAAELEEMLRRLRDDGFAAAGDAELITAIEQLETMKCVAAAGQARLTARFAASREAELARYTGRDKRDRARRDIGTQPDGDAAAGAGFRGMIDGVLDGGVDVRAVGLAAGLDGYRYVLRVRCYGCCDEDGDEGGSHGVEGTCAHINL